MTGRQALLHKAKNTIPTNIADKAVILLDCTAIAPPSNTKEAGVGVGSDEVLMLNPEAVTVAGSRGRLSSDEAEAEAEAEAATDVGTEVTVVVRLDAVQSSKITALSAILVGIVFLAL